MEIDHEVRARIDGVLEGIERDDGVSILVAVESGSRAWGFPSPNSDYDVRFIYARPLDWYLSIDRRRDVIERPIVNDLDVSGWDIKKALQLLVRSNPVLLEWLGSPIVYRRVPWVTRRLSEHADRCLNRAACSYHYLHLAEGQYRRFIDGRESVAVKKYFYSLRPALALRWLGTHPHGRPPMSLPALLADVSLPDEVASLTSDLVQRKLRSKELGEGPRLAVLDGFILGEVQRARRAAPRRSDTRADFTGAANELFREIVRGAALG